MTEHHLLLLLLLFSALRLASASINLCPPSQCTNSTTQVRFPFRLQNQQPPNCGFQDPAFNLTCTPLGQLILNIPRSGDFFVRHINYLTQQIHLRDPSNCIASRLLTLDLSASPFQAVFRQNYTFISCPSTTQLRFATIDCLSNSSRSVYATSAGDVQLAASLPSSCHVVAALLVPVSWPDLFGQGLPTDLVQDIQLTWYRPNCGECEARGGVCGFESNMTTMDIVCVDDQASGITSNGLRVLRIICLTVGVPTLACAIAISVYTCCKDRRGSQQARPAQWSTSTSLVAPQPEVVATGLDESTIESYQKLVLGDSRRLPARNGTTCAICLAEYLSKETIRCIPECSHCFHADCIDEWLRMNSTCPVCRNSPPSPPPVYSQDHEQV